MITHGFHLAVCKNNFNPYKTSDMLQGSYVNQATARYGKVSESILVLNKTRDAFSINRIVSFQRFRNGKFQSNEYLLEYWLAIYDEQTRELTEFNQQRIMTYSATKKKLFLRNRVYIKIK
jgi:hypothetical protein